MQGVKFLVLLFIILFICEYYTYQCVKTITKSKNIALIVLVVNIILDLVVFYLATTLDRHGDRDKFQYVSVLFFAIFLPKLMLSFPMLLEDIYRGIRYLFSFTSSGEGYMPSRRRAISLFAGGLAGFTFFGIIYGIIKGKFNYKVERVNLKLPNLPEEFRGFKIVQISDIHSGSFHKSAKEEILRGINLLNEQNPDLVLFTGDLVNLIADEIIPFKDVFSKIKSNYGKFSVLGNHDYGGYYYGNDEVKNSENRQLITDHLKDMGFTQLRNEHVQVQKDGAFINLVGVENFGADLRFPKTGDLDKATEGLEPGTTNILMSHDPTHFDHHLEDYVNVIDFPIPMHLTLSGHTHGMQFGVDIPGVFKFSPIQFIYKNWAGLYNKKGKYLYVNKGFGYLGFPGRVGIWPEITVFILEPEE